MTDTNEATQSSRKMPDYPPMGIIALVGSVLATATAFGLDVTAEQQEAIENLVKTFVVIGGADYVLRMVRNISSR